MVVLVLFCAALGVAHAFPHLPVGRALHAFLIERPAGFLATLTPMKLLGGALLIACVVALAPALPAEIVFLAAGDAALYVEVLAAIAVLSVKTAGLQTISRLISRTGPAVARIVRPARRSSTTRAHRRPVARGGDVEEGPEFVFA